MGLKDVRVLHYERAGPDVELMIEQVLGEVRCPRCERRAQVKERPVVPYVDLPVYGTADVAGLEEAPHVLSVIRLRDEDLGALVITASRPRTAC